MLGVLVHEVDATIRRSFESTLSVTAPSIWTKEARGEGLSRELIETEAVMSACEKTPRDESDLFRIASLILAFLQVLRFHDCASEKSPSLNFVA